MQQKDPALNASDLAKRLIGYLERALRHAEAATAEGALARGGILAMGAFHEQAAEQFSQALALDPEQHEAAARLILVQLRAGDEQKALRTAVEFASRAPEYAMDEITTGGRIGACSLLGLALVANGRKHEAARAFENAEQAVADDSVAWAYLAQIGAEQGRIARDAGTEAARRNPRFQALGALLDASATHGGILSPVAVGAVSRLDQVSAHGRPLFIDGEAEVASLIDGNDWADAPVFA